MVNTYTLSDVQEFETFRHNTHICDTIMAEGGVDALAAFLQKQVLNTYHSNPHVTKQPLLVTLAKHYHKDLIAQAIATAWINDSDTFTLSKLSFVERWGKRRIVLISIFLTIIPAMTYLFVHMVKHNPGVAGVFLGLEPLLALPGSIISWLLYELIMKVWK
jgi:hypothetical protein